ncbi:GNAT family N-acetyltransferase [Fructobacillus sp. M1-13]|uniref:GNAT family N-acetyltransferase n=1 Tax=Fructobacillus papyriferae TaxID=2713171 RepID=A0ABS5QQL8_9LACO|nr:GNAT family N-acetyltransferase [Fructobacillus papyriferae]MBS9334634.1 GNAT family N-acetyltransferase [Fructobacillus papyriferae]MCD2158624.1 GNAT family N-acetyltransferase [Fructobacillus papyriferae]
MWICKKLNQLTAEEFYSMEKLRIDTFVVEQGIQYKDLDETDKVAYHLGYLENDQCLAYARIFQDNHQVHFGRVASSSAVRGQGYGRQLMQQILTFCEESWPNLPIEIEAQHQVVSLYQKFGFQTVGQPFILEGIVHQKMIKQ